MKTSRASLLVHPLFVVSLAALLLNDFYWKYAYGNWVTGKLSDFAGMIVLPVFIRALLNNRFQKTIGIGCALFFIWWKSPLSQPVIGFLNHSLHLLVERVVDYGDLFALVVLPFACNLQPVSLRAQPLLHKSLQWSFGVLTAFSLCATSLPSRRLFEPHPQIDDLYYHESFTIKWPALEVLKRLEQKGIDYHRDSIVYYPVVGQENLFYRKPSSDSTPAWRQLPQPPDSVIYVKWQGRPYYLIPRYTATNHLGTQEIYDVRFNLSQNRKGTKTTVTIEMFRVPALGRFDLFDNKTRKEYKRIFERAFE